VAASSSRPRGHTRRTRNRHLSRYHPLHPPKSRSRKNRRRLREYPYIGALIPGYPRLDRSDPGFNERFWKIYHHTITT
jgi:hypothetical protein